MSAHFANVWEAYHFLADHVVRGSNGSSFLDVLDIFVVKVNPANNTIDDDPAVNTAIRIWLESGPGTEHIDDGFGHEGDVQLHDPALDVGGASFEEALIKLAGKVRTHYGIGSWNELLAAQEAANPTPISPDLAAFLVELDSIEPARPGLKSSLD
jgi:hypothetical protein